MDGDPGRPTDRRTIIYLWELPVEYDTHVLSSERSARSDRRLADRTGILRSEFLRIFFAHDFITFFFISAHRIVLPPPAPPTSQRTHAPTDRRTLRRMRFRNKRSVPRTVHSAPWLRSSCSGCCGPSSASPSAASPWSLPRCPPLSHPAFHTRRVHPAHTTEHHISPPKILFLKSKKEIITTNIND